VLCAFALRSDDIERAQKLCDEAITRAIEMRNQASEQVNPYFEEAIKALKAFNDRDPDGPDPRQGIRSNESNEPNRRNR
jgi:hypothetical protein